MDEDGAPTAATARASLPRRLIVWGLIVGVIWVPAVVTLAMLLTGHAGR